MHNPTLRVMEILNLLCQSDGPMRLSQISRELNMPKSTLLPILQTLVSGHYLTKENSDHYGPGYALLGLGAAAGKVYSASGVIRESLKAVAEEFDETCYFGVLEEGWVRYVERVDSNQPIRMLTAIGHRLPAYATAIGKALLMDKTPHQIRLLYPGALEPLTAHTIRDTETLVEQLTQLQSLGYAWEAEESTEHIRCLAVPVRKNGETVGAVSIAVPVFRFRKEMEAKMVDALKNAVNNIENGLKIM